jgi:hypothetical protein
MIVRVFIALASLMALPALGWHPLETAGADIPEKQLSTAAAITSGLPSSSYSFTPEIDPATLAGTIEGDLCDTYAPGSSPAGFIPIA